MRGGISVWLNVPLECLARRISAVGTDSRPLLHGESGDAYSKVWRLPFSCLTSNLTYTRFFGAFASDVSEPLPLVFLSSLDLLVGFGALGNAI